MKFFVNEFDYNHDNNILIICSKFDDFDKEHDKQLDEKEF